MKSNLNSLRSIVNRIDELRETGKNPYKQIQMEREKQNITYAQLAEKIEGLEPDTLRKILTNGKRIDYDLVQKLNAILGIQDVIDNSEAIAVYHYEKNRPAHVGKPSKDEKEEQQKLYDEAQRKKSNPEKGEYSMDELLLDFADNSDEWEYNELIHLDNERRKEIDFLKRALLIYREFPQAFDELFSTITFEEQDEENLKCLEIEIREY